jgi:L-ascorbate metabolism protein UlaG (beta-lactamase superfamily)
MDITYLGHSSFRIKGKNCSLVCDPYDGIGIKFPKVEAQIVTVSHEH